jgi:tetratricopeptide (TPR) repeat protein
LLLVLLVPAPSFADDAARERVEKKIARAKKTAEAKYHSTADELFAAAANAAREGAFKDLEDEANTNRATNLENWIARPGTAPLDYQFACNNLGVLRLRQNKPAQAVEAFARVKEPKGPDAYIYLANHARALEKAGRATEALDLYLNSLRAEPRFALVAERTVNLLTDGKVAVPGDKRREDAAKLLGTKDLPVQTLRTVTGTLLSAWKDEEAAEDVLPFLVRYLADSNATPDWFARNEKARFAEWEKSPRLKNRLEELRGVYESEKFAAGIPVLRADLAKTLPAWSKALPEPLRPDLARALAAAGDGFAHRARFAPEPARQKVLAEQAIQRFALAAALVRDNTQARAAALAVFAEHRERLDPGWTVLDRYTKELFGDDTSVYASDHLTAPDYRSLGRLHTALAAIFETKGERWGKEKNGVLSVEFQLTKAIAAEEELYRLGAGADYPASPGLRSRLAEALRRAGKKPEAVAAFRAAADLYLTLGNAAQMNQVIKRYRALRDNNELPATADEPVFTRLEELAKAAPQRPWAERGTETVPRAVTYLEAAVVGYGDGPQLFAGAVSKNKIEVGSGER